MKKNLLVVILMFSSLLSYSQKRKTIYVEALGNGLLVSGNFDMRLKADQNDGLGIRAGIGGGSFSGFDDMGNSANVGLVTFPLAVNYLAGKKRSSFESGIGVTPIYVTGSGTINDDVVEGSGFGVTGFLNMGYRYQPIKSGVMFHLKWTPAFNSAGFSPSWFGLGLGYSFK